MNFISLDYVFFCLLVIPIYFLLNLRWRWILILLSSYLFYGYWNTSYIFLIVFSTVVDYFAAIGIDKARDENKARRTLYLSLSIFVNLGVLFTFKYFNFFNSAISDTVVFLGLNYNPSELNLLLPVGISFYTFQSMAYTIDVYRGNIKPERHILIFASYVAFFPQLVAGPIERASNLIPQFHKKYDFDYDRIVSGLRQILWGVFKKVVIADYIGLYVDVVYNDVTSYSGVILVIATLFFAYQIYCDFSGYSDIAIGTARILGFDLMDNFRQPYLSNSIREFWRRWHISLSTWFRDYVYIPLGGNRVPLTRNLANLMIVFVVSGLWHGANWTFIIWGALHGGYIVVETLISRQFSTKQAWFTQLLTLALTFTLVNIAWVFFRANTLSDAVYVFQNLFNFSTGLNGITAPFADGLFRPHINLVFGCASIAFLMIVEFSEQRAGLIWDRWGQVHPIMRWGWYYGLTGLILLLLLTDTTPSFIYFQF